MQSVYECDYCCYSGFEVLRGMGKLKEREEGEEEGEGGEREGVMCDRVPEDGMRSDGETSDRTEEEHMSLQVSNTVPPAPLAPLPCSHV